MPIVIIPYDQDPRRKASDSKYRQPPAVNSKEYPRLPSQMLVDYIESEGKLPVEIRNMIWEDAMRGERYLADSRYHTWDEHLIDPVQIRNYHTNRVARPKFLPSICFLMKGTMLEATHVFIEKSTFMVASYPGNQYLQDWLNTVDGMSRVRSLQFDFFDCFPANIAVNSDLQLATRCTGLTKIRMGFHCRALSHYETAEELIPRYQLQQLFECGKLEQVVFQAKPQGSYDENTQKLLADLGTIIVAKFAEKGRRVVTSII